MKLSTCMQCGSVVSNKRIALVEHKRICHDCRKANKWEMRKWTGTNIKSF
jgi:formylmethanofuran dehydrogenase subunit E